MATTKTVFIVDDERTQTTMLEDYLSKFDWLKILTFNSGEECIKNLHENPDIVFLDYNFDLAGTKALDGIQILNSIKAQCPDAEIVMMSGQDNVEIAMNTVRYGAYDYIVKNESAFQRAETAIMNIIGRQKLKSEARTYKRMMVIFGILAVAMVVCFVILLSMSDQFKFYGKTPE